MSKVKAASKVREGWGTGACVSPAWGLALRPPLQLLPMASWSSWLPGALPGEPTDPD